MGADRVLIVAAHPDDEVLGCGGTMARHAAAGDRVHVLFLADGESARASADAAAIERRRKQARAAAEVLGAAEPAFADFPDNRMDTVALLDVVKAVEGAVARIEPAVVYCHHARDLNVDHRIAHEAVITACRPLPGASVRAIYGFETPSSTEWGVAGAPFAPTRFVDIADHLQVKLSALACYGNEMRPFPHPRSDEALSALGRWRGASAGLACAEAFEVIREVEADGVSG